MKHKTQIIASVLQVTLLLILSAARLTLELSNPYIIHGLEVSIALTLLAFGSNIVTGILTMPFLVRHYFKTWTKRIAYRNADDSMVEKDRASTVINEAST